MNAKIPVTIFTGFLGAGKTTLIANLLNQCQGSRIVVLVNEFGKVSIDGQALSRLEVPRQIEVIALSAPLIAYDDDQEFQLVLTKMLQNQVVPDHLIIETSGLAVPTAVIETLRRPQFIERFVIDATLTVVDIPLLLSNINGQQQALTTDSAISATAEVFALQLNAADVVVLNKIDELGDSELVAAEAAIRTLSPAVRFVELAYRGQLNPRVALGLRLNQTVAATFAHELVAVATHGHSDGHKHSGLDTHQHGLDSHTHVHEHDPGWLSFALSSKEPQERDSLRHALQTLVVAEPVIRLKGQIVTADGHELAVQGVRERVEIDEHQHNHGHEHTHEHEHSHDHDHSHAHDHDHTHDHAGGQIVFIGYHLSREKVSASLSELTGTNWE
jgi:cobalamin biosynthesis protein CobW